MRTGSIRTVAVLAAGLALAACGSTGARSGEQACTEIGAPAGIGIEVEPGTAATAQTGTLGVCWGGQCREVPVEMRESTGPGDTGCSGDVCSAEVRPTGGRNGFADLSDLPATAVTLTVKLADASGATLVDRTIEVTAAVTHPNGAQCPGGGVQAQVVVTADGTLTSR